ncbi:transposase [Bradyrhizobium sp. STM 3809]|uniref:transposase n=1 Tax=Bradyrhizobium sp. STM 3809 TaxID=551936 RepID=UPI0002409CF3|nr:transposase [Bradyrhizobium sp. STM 3809]CCE01559.1 transposase [Bradyrhizobium sp. STM 3809]
MRRSLHTEHEILVLLCEAESGVPIAEICSTAGVSLRTFYRWRQRYGGLTSPALRHLKELEIENQRLRALVTSLVQGPPKPASERPAPRPVRQDCGSTPHGVAGAPGQARGAVIGRYASVRYGR